MSRIAYLILPVFLALFKPILATSAPTAQNVFGRNITYSGIYANEVEGFIGIRFGQDTGGSNRFKPPVPYTPTSGRVIQATTRGPACPQQVSSPSSNYFSLSLSTITEISEDCLRLNVWRPNGTAAGDKLPALLYVYGGGLSGGSKDDGISQPGGLILQSITNGYPVMAVELNYRLGVFGFAQSKALEKEGSENAGVRDQRLALEWVYDNIAAFGGDPDRITIHGQSSGGLSVGIQVMAYGASKPYPFQQAICESQALEVAITSNVTRRAQEAILPRVNCDTTPYDSPSTVACLRNVSMQHLIDAQLKTSSEAPAQDWGDQWLPTVDGDFLPAAPSQLIYEHRFANATVIMGWCDNDADIFLPPTIKNGFDTHRFIHNYLPGLTNSSLEKLLSLYPPEEFYPSHYPNGTVEYDAQFFRAGRIARDVLFTCQPILYGAHLKAAGNEVYYYTQNQTLLTPILNAMGEYGLGTVHTSELIFVFGNLSKFDNIGFPYHPSGSDFKLRDQESRSWSTFAAVGKPSLEGHDTLQGWRPAEFEDENYGVYVIGGPYAGYAGVRGNSTARSVIKAERLRERCGFINSPEIVRQLRY